MASLFLIRHGQASFGSANYDQLSPLGQQQADETGLFLKRAGVVVHQAFAGTLSRQQETATRVMAHQESTALVQTDARFNEIDNEGQLAELIPLLTATHPNLRAWLDSGESKSYQKVIEAVFNTWVDPECPPLNTQSWREYRQAAMAALKAVMSSAPSGSNSAVFTSGGTIATLVSAVLGVSDDRVYQFYEPVFNCSITRFIFSQRGVALSSFNDIGHLQYRSADLDCELVSYR